MPYSNLKQKIVTSKQTLPRRSSAVNHHQPDQEYKKQTLSPIWYHAQRISRAFIRNNAKRQIYYTPGMYGWTKPVRTQCKNKKLPMNLGLPNALLIENTSVHWQGCAHGHYQRAPHNRKTYTPPPAQTIVTDIARPMPKTDNGHKHFLKLADLSTRMRIVYLMRKRTETSRYITEATKNWETVWEAYIANQVR